MGGLALSEQANVQHPMKRVIVCQTEDLGEEWWAVAVSNRGIMSVSIGAGRG